jgi:hypothetical protein
VLFVGHGAGGALLFWTPLVASMASDRMPDGGVTPSLESRDHAGKLETKATPSAMLALSKCGHRIFRVKILTRKITGF